MNIVSVIKLQGGRITYVKSFVTRKKPTLDEAMVFTDKSTDYFIKECKKIGWGKNGEGLGDLLKEGYYWDGGSKEVEMVNSDKVKVI